MPIFSKYRTVIFFHAQWSRSHAGNASGSAVHTAGDLVHAGHPTLAQSCRLIDTSHFCLNRIWPVHPEHLDTDECYLGCMAEFV